MTCYSPRIRIEDLTKWETALDGHKYHPAKIEGTKELEKYDHYFSAGHYKIIPIPCKECIGCKLDYSREWANRGYLESLDWEQNYFVTLTYNEENITIPDEIVTPNEFTFTIDDIEEIEWQGTLVPKELQDFMKRLRINMTRKYGQKGPIRAMMAGEYGGQTKRPHYHLILFNLQLPAESFYEPRIKWEKYTYYKNHIIDEAWQNKGFADICEANWNTMAYVARYITKKINGKQSEIHYGVQGQIKEFMHVSNRPGIARNYYEKNKDEIYQTDKIMIKNAKGIHYVKPPKYFDELYKKEHPREFERIKEIRRKRMLDQLRLKAKSTSLNRYEQLQIEKTTKENCNLTLKRPLD